MYKINKITSMVNKLKHNNNQLRAVKKTKFVSLRVKDELYEI